VARATYHHGDLGPALIAAARRLVERAGPSGATVRAIAREADVTPAAPYHHFANRDAILASLATDGFAELGAAMQRAADRAPTGQALRRLQGAGVAYVRFAVRNPGLFRLMFSGMLTDRSTYPDLQQSATEAFRVLQHLLGDARDTDRGALPHPAALAAWSTVHGLAMLLIEGRLGEPPSERRAIRMARDVTRVLGVGLRTFAGSPSS